MSHSSETATAHTLDFILFYLPPPPARLWVLGTDALIHDLEKRGYAVTKELKDETAVLDGIAFAHFLHRLPLEETLRSARRALRPRALLLVDDFDQEAALAVFPQARQELRISGTIESATHSGNVMAQALAKHFAHVECGTAPYFYRMSHDPLAALARENELVDKGEWPAVGRRWLAVNPLA